MFSNQPQNKTVHFVKKLASPLLGKQLCFLLALCLFSFPVSAQTADESDLEKLQTTIEREKRAKEILELQGHALAQEARNLRRQMIEAAQRTQEQEYLIDNLGDRLVILREDVAYRKKKLSERSGQLSSTLGALTKLSDDSASAFFLFPGTPRQSVHSAMLLKSAVPALRDRALVLRQELDSLAAVEDDITNQLVTLQEASAKLETEQEELSSLINRKDRLVKRTEAAKSDAQKRVAKLVREAKSMQDLLSKLQKVRPSARPEEPTAGDEAATSVGQPAPSAILMAKPDSVRAFPKSGGLPFPASGRVVQRYGQDLGFGQSAKGIKIRTRAKAQLIAPHDGQIAFAGPFREHGLIVIIEHLGGYHTILSGLEKAHVVTGQWILAGEPVGSMSANKTNGLELYVELRRDGKPLNPLRWFKRS